jgi:hypothetical protein
MCTLEVRALLGWGARLASSAGIRTDGTSLGAAEVPIGTAPPTMRVTTHGIPVCLCVHTLPENPNAPEPSIGQAHTPHKVGMQGGSLAPVTHSLAGDGQKRQTCPWQLGVGSRKMARRQPLWTRASNSGHPDDSMTRTMEEARFLSGPIAS